MKTGLNTPLVAIKCLVYNHEPYLRDCLEGFVMQQTNFPYVAIVHDDASTDGSAAIIHEYEVKYPHIFKPIYETENIYKKGGFGAIDDIMLHAINATSAKYVAMCEGDDYWTDPLKLQKQVDFLEEHQDYSMCFHKVMVDSFRTEDKILYDHLCERQYSSSEIYEKWTIPTCSVVYRRSHLNLKKIRSCVFGDIVLFLSLAEGGKLYCLDFMGGVYRRHQKGVSSQVSYNQHLALYKQYREMVKAFPSVKAISVRRKKLYLSQLLYEKSNDDTWKYRIQYMLLEKKWIFSRFLIITVLEYMIQPWLRKLKDAVCHTSERKKNGCI